MIEWIQNRLKVIRGESNILDFPLSKRIEQMVKETRYKKLINNLIRRNTKKDFATNKIDDNVTNMPNAHYSQRYGWHLRNDDNPQKSVDGKGRDNKGNE